MIDPRDPQVGDAVWSRTHYRRIVEVRGLMEDGRWNVLTLDERDEQLYPMALTFREPEAKRTRAPGAGRPDKPRLTPELRQAVEDGLVCRARHHDLTGAMPSGKPSVWIGKDGSRACRWCKAEAAERHAARVSDRTNRVQVPAEPV